MIKVERVVPIPALNCGDEAPGCVTCSWSFPNDMIYYPFLQLFSQSSFFIFTISYSYLLFPQGSQFCWLFTPSCYSWCCCPGKFHLGQQFCKVMPLFIHSFSFLAFLMLLSSEFSKAWPAELTLLHVLLCYSLHLYFLLLFPS